MTQSEVEGIVVNRIWPGRIAEGKTHLFTRISELLVPNLQWYFLSVPERRLRVFPICAASAPLLTELEVHRVDDWEEVNCFVCQRKIRRIVFGVLSS